MDGQ
jgi:hypothetical protein